MVIDRIFRIQSLSRQLTHEDALGKTLMLLLEELKKETAEAIVELRNSSLYVENLSRLPYVFAVV